MNGHKIAGLFMAVIMSAGSITVTNYMIRDTYATDQSDIQDAQNEADATQQKIDELNSQLNSLTNDIESTQSYISELDQTVANITTQLLDYQNQISAKQTEIDNKQIEIDNKKAEIDSTQVTLDETKATEAEQYEAMKLRIQYMYECGDETFLDMIFSSGDLSDLLGKTEYISSITSYDRKQLEALAETKETISTLLAKLETDKTELDNQKSELEGQKTELVSLQKDLQQQQSYVETLLNDKETAVSQMESQQGYIEIAKAEEEAKLKAQQETAKRLQAMWEEEQKKLQETGGNADEENQKKLDEIGLAGGFTWPLPGYNYITSYFGPRISPITGAYSNHSGVDISGGSVYGKPVVAAYDGTVSVVDIWTSSDTETSKPYGTSIQIDHGAGVVTLYAHLSGVAVSAGQTVKAGQVIGYVGNTGASRGAHLHLTMYLKGVLADPLAYFTIPTY